MGRTLIPQEELEGTSIPRFFCPYCQKYRYWTYASGVEASFLGRYIVVRCRTCQNLGIWGQ